MGEERGRRKVFWLENGWLQDNETAKEAINQLPEWHRKSRRERYYGSRGKEGVKRGNSSNNKWCRLNEVRTEKCYCIYQNGGSGHEFGSRLS